MNESLQRQIVALAEADEHLRAELAAQGELFAGYHPRMAELHGRNALALQAIMGQHGWPGKSLVGEAGQQAAWLVVQHAIGLPSFQRACLLLLRQAVAAGAAEPVQVAYLEDRIAFFERRPQRYGTQFDWDEGGQMRPWKLESPERVDEYRLSVGLEPLVDVAARMLESTKHVTPPDFAERQAELEAWARSVGWI